MVKVDILTLVWPSHWPTCHPSSDGSWPPPLPLLSVWSGASPRRLTPRQRSRVQCVLHLGPSLYGKTKLCKLRLVSRVFFFLSVWHACLRCKWHFRWPLSGPALGWWTWQSCAGSAECKIPWISPAWSPQGSELPSMAPVGGLPRQRCPHYHHRRHLNCWKDIKDISVISTLNLITIAMIL